MVLKYFVVELLQITIYHTISTPQNRRMSPPFHSPIHPKISKPTYLNLQYGEFGSSCKKDNIEKKCQSQSTFVSGGWLGSKMILPIGFFSI